MTVSVQVPNSRVRQRIRVPGVVQGVGFRPFVFNLAERFGLMGFIGNDSDGVFIEVEGDANSLDAFHDALSKEKPPLAHIESIEVAELAPLTGRSPRWRCSPCAPIVLVNITIRATVAFTPSPWRVRNAARTSGVRLPIARRLAR